MGFRKRYGKKRYGKRRKKGSRRRTIRGYGVSRGGIRL